MRTPKPTVAASNEASSNGSSSRSPWIHSIAGSLRRARSSIRPEKSSPITVGRPALRAAIARSPVPQPASSTRSPGRTTAARGQPAPALVEPDGHDAVHHVVDRRDPVEHRADGVGRERPGLVVTAPTSATSACSRPSWSSTRATTKSTRSSTSRRRGRSRARGRGSWRRRGAASSMFSRWIVDSGVSRGQSTSLRSSLSATDAARWIRFALRRRRPCRACPSSTDR